MNQRVIPWGTVVTGAIALGTTVLIGLTEIAGVSLPFRSAGPAAVIVVGVLILVTGLVVVLRSNRAGHAAGHTAPSGPAGEGATPQTSSTATSTPPPATESVPGPLEVPTAADPEPADADARQSSH